MLNLAHGARFFMLGGYAAWQATSSYAVALAAGTLSVGLLRLVIERVIIRHFYRRPDEDQLRRGHGRLAGHRIAGEIISLTSMVNPGYAYVMLFAAMTLVLLVAAAIVLVEQNLAATLVLADRVYIINNGHIAHEAPAAELRAQPEILHRYLGV